MSNFYLKWCPFYISDYENYITCEDCKKVFSSKEAKNKYGKLYCSSPEMHSKCPIAKRLYEKYEKEE